MYYEINVALNGQHFFATAKRSLTSKPVFLKAYRVIRAKFPESEGYGISATEYREVGTPVDTEAIDKTIGFKK